MKRTGKILCCALGVLMTAGLAAACGEDAGGASGETITLNVWCPEADHDFAKQVAEDFKAAHPDKKYKFIFGIQGENDAGTKVLNDPTNAPDCFSFASDQITKLINGGALARIGGSRLTRMKETNDADAIDSATVPKKNADGVEEQYTYAFPYTDNTYFLYYNKEKLSESDLGSLDSILAKCRAPKTNGDDDVGEMFAYPMNDGWYAAAFYFGKGLGYTVKLDESFAETEITTTFNSEEGKNVTYSMWKLVQDLRVKPDSDDSKIIAGFSDGSIIAGVTGIWNKNGIEKALGDNMGAYKLPTYTYYAGESDTTGSQVQLVSYAGYKLMGVCDYSKNKADALDFAEFYTNSQSQVKHFAARGFRPTDKTAKEDSSVTSDVCCQAIKAQLEHSKSQKFAPTTIWTPLQGLGNEMIAKRTAGGFDLQTQFDALIKGISKPATAE